MSDPVPAIAEASATGAVAEIFADVCTVLGVEVVNLIAVLDSPGVLQRGEDGAVPSRLGSGDRLG